MSIFFIFVAVMGKPEISTYDFNNQKTELGLEIIPLNRITKIKSMAVDFHRLNFYQILVITKGSGMHEIDFQKVPYSENTAIPVSKGQVQRYTFDYGLEGYAVVFTPEFLIKEDLDYNYLYDFTIFQHTLGSIGCEANQTVYTLLEEMLSEQEKIMPFNTGEYQRNLLKNFLIQLERNKREHTEIVCTDSLDLFMKFRKLLEKNVNYKAKVNDFCDQLNVTGKQLNASLKLYNNITAKQFIDDRVLLEIKRLLVYSTLSIKEIAYGVGFEDPTNFTKYFKARMNMLPTDYRKQQN